MYVCYNIKQKMAEEFKYNGYISLLSRESCCELSMAIYKFKHYVDNFWNKRPIKNEMKMRRMFLIYIFCFYISVTQIPSVQQYI